MGLDNGIIIRGKTEKGVNFLQEYYKEEVNKWDPGAYEIVYWRKCWNLRGRMLDTFVQNNFYDEYHIELSLFDLAIVVEKVLKYFLDEKNWDRGASIWSWHVAVRFLGDQIFDIRNFLENVSEADIHNEDLDIYFYDSY